MTEPSQLALQISLPSTVWLVCRELGQGLKPIETSERGNDASRNVELYGICRSTCQRSNLLNRKYFALTLTFLFPVFSHIFLFKDDRTHFIFVQFGNTCKWEIFPSPHYPHLSFTHLSSVMAIRLHHLFFLASFLTRSFAS